MNFKIFTYHYYSSNDCNEHIIEIPYCEKIKRINGNVFRKYFIIDIRNLDYLEEFFNNFDDFQEEFLADEFYNLATNAEYPVNLSLCFLGGSRSIIHPYEVLYNTQYALKEFISEDDYEKIMLGSDDLIVPKREKIYEYNDHSIHTSNFNLVYGFNGSGKTQFLKHISAQEKVPLFLLNRRFDSDAYLSSSAEKLLNLEEIFDYCKSQNIPLLLDDLCWGTFDEINLIKIIDELYANSHDINVFFTVAQVRIRGLVRSRSHNPNIINFNR